MTQGVILFARNNPQVDYVKQAHFLAKRIRKYLDLPTTIVTDSEEYLINAYPDYTDVFDNVISIPWKLGTSMKRYHDGAITQKKLDFRNDARCMAYDLSPYTETLLLDTDYVVSDSIFKNCFTQNGNFLIYKDAYDLANFRDYSEFKYISDTSVDFYWATCVFFRKTEVNKIFFDLVAHIQDNWQHYNSIFQINSSVFRNDHAFSIAIHIMNGYQSGPFANIMPGKLFYTTDKDLLVKLKDEQFLFLTEKEKHLGEYVPIKFANSSVHVMNKFSLNRVIDEAQND
jgi:hypothetical protein|tara:strand:- start:859 stop:1713 length:855 start_codon:yes stop_codon:yes gene_type:complete